MANTLIRLLTITLSAGRKEKIPIPILIPLGTSNKLEERSQMASVPCWNIFAVRTSFLHLSGSIRTCILFDISPMGGTL